MKQEDAVLEALLDRYFELAAKEDYPSTPKLTDQLDKFEKAIRERTHRVAIHNAS